MNQTTTSVFNSVFNAFGPSERLLFYVLGIVMFVSGLSVAWKANNLFMTEVPTRGGTFTEGVVGSPRFINPLLAIGDTDKSLTTLIYSGLLKHGKDGGYEADLAEYYSVSSDGLIYEIKIKEDAFFHNKAPVTAEDVQFTIEKALDPVLKSPRESNWEGVAIQIVDEKTIKFILKKPYYPFFENLTMGILPKNLWEDAGSEEFPFSQRNIEPVGSGPFKFSSIKRNSSGVPTLITLESFDKYTGEKPFISKMEIRFFKDESDLVNTFEEGALDAVAGLSPETAQELKEGGAYITSSLMPRVFGAFFNQNQATIFTDAQVRKALDTSVDKQSLVKEVLKGFGVALDGPIPHSRTLITSTSTLGSSATSTSLVADPIEKAKNILSLGGWKLNGDGVLEKKVKSSTQVLAFSIATSDAPELKRTAEILAETWNKLGAKVDIKVFESGDLNQNVIKPRKYDVLLFGEVVGRDLDFYPFWHSSSRNDPGLNIALYANITSDKLLEDMRAATEESVLKEKLTAFEAEVRKDIPAVFTYAPEFIYVISPRVKNINLSSLSNPSDRFLGIENWYIETDKVWDIFVKN